MSPTSPLLSLKHLYKGKVRDVYEVDENRLLLLTSNRVSAYDRVFAEPVPHKAQVLNLLSGYWFQKTARIISNHMISTRVEECLPNNPEVWPAYKGNLALVHRTTPVRYECVVRGHLDGSGWKEYQETTSVCGIKLPSGLNRYDPLPEPIFTPAVKNDQGHDENVSFEFMVNDLGTELSTRLRETSLQIYRFGYQHVQRHGLILLDTKFEFGFKGDELLLIDEVLTPDSSRYRSGAAGTASTPLALDKQYLRDSLAARGFTGEGPTPQLDVETIRELSARYQSVFLQITGEHLETYVHQHG
ncbi:MAG: phosphoribosylaminoimidazolesuccinocarboxamide synthase [Sumerlaeia bacterium]